MPAPRTPDRVREDIEKERESLATAVEHLRGELGDATDLTGKLRSKLPVLAVGAAAAGFFLGGGVGASMRYLARRGREGDEKAKVGRWSLRERG
ncbi:MAG TPA: hypothetical protein VF186_09410 [Gaiellaceae bacterium]|jgi:hypothetical protein